MNVTTIRHSVIIRFRLLFASKVILNQQIVVESNWFDKHWCLRWYQLLCVSELSTDALKRVICGMISTKVHSQATQKINWDESLEKSCKKFWKSTVRLHSVPFPKQVEEEGKVSLSRAFFSFLPHLFRRNRLSIGWSELQNTVKINWNVHEEELFKLMEKLIKSWEGDEKKRLS